VKPVKGLKVEDLKDLQELVAQHAEALEPGLRVVDSRVQLGTATVDLLALDAGGTPTLVVVGFVADDELLLRALDAYAWCRDDPEGLRRLHPAVRPAADEPPRVIVVAEQLPETFLRKARHLRIHRVDFFQFHFGLSFKPVAAGRADEVATRPVPRRPEPTARVEPPARDAVGPELERRPLPPRPLTTRVDVARLDTSRLEAPRPEPSRLEPRADGAPGPGLRSEVARPLVAPAPRPPANGRGPAAPAEPAGLDRPRAEETPAVPTAARALDRARGEVDGWKVSVVREYLQREFPTAVIYDFYAHDRGAQMFHLQDNLGAVIHTAAVAEDVLAELSEAEIRAHLDRHKLARVLRQAGQAGVAVTRAGLKIERT
jgi:hypothetical protein